MKDLLKNILEEAKNAFQNFQTEGKIIVWQWDGQNGYDYSVETEETFLNRIENRFNKMIEEDEEEVTYDNVYNNEFDFDCTGWKEYYNPVEMLKDEDYKYVYLICHNVNNKECLETVVYSNVEINSESEMTSILESKEEDVPEEFGTEWANYYFQELNTFESGDLYKLYKEENDYNTVYIE